MSGGVVDCT